MNKELAPHHARSSVEIAWPNEQKADLIVCGVTWS